MNRDVSNQGQSEIFRCERCPDIRIEVTKVVILIITSAEFRRMILALLRFTIPTVFQVTWLCVTNVDIGINDRPFCSPQTKVHLSWFSFVWFMVEVMHQKLRRPLHRSPVRQTVRPELRGKLPGRSGDITQPEVNKHVWMS